MALFKRYPKTEVTAEKAAPAPKPMRAAGGPRSSDLSHILMRPRITEKATMATGMGVYVFNVAPRANKRQILEAVAKYYKVTPRMVRVVSIPAKSVRNMRTGQRGTSHGGKKAYIYLKKGETITVS